MNSSALSSPQAIIHGLNVVLRLPSEALRRLFARFRVRPACCIASPCEAFRKLFARFRARPACCIAPSRRSFPQAISTVWCPSSMLYRFLPAKLSAGYFHGLVSVQHAVSHLPAKLSASYFHGFVSVQHAVPRERFIVKNQ